MFLKIEFWHEVWREGRLGFDQPSTNYYLLNIMNKWLCDGPHEVLVPLCGRSVDMLAIQAAGHTVVGVECVEQAIEDFSTLHQITFQRSQPKAHIECFSAERYRLYCADFFKLNRTDLNLSDAPLKIWDRAALVALPASMRQNYYDQLRSLSSNSMDWMCLLFTYDSETDLGPPFSVNVQELIDAMMPSNFNVEIIEERSLQPQNPKFVEAGVIDFHETLVRVTKQ